MKLLTLRALSISCFALIAGAGLTLATSANATEAPAAVKPCTTKKFATKEVEAACKKGGVKEAKKIMKAVVKKSKAAGEGLKCKDCHTSVKTFELKPDAVEKLKKLL